MVLGNLFNFSIVILLGCPNLLFSPTPINAILGFTAFKNSSLEEVFAPWCAILITVLSKILLSLYLSKTLKERNVEVTRLAHGLPMGANLDYADELTLIKAMEGRIKQ